MAHRQLVRTALTWVNGTTLAALAICAVARVRPRRGPDGVLIASGYRLPVPTQSCFTVGSVIFTRQPAGFLLAPERRDLLAHETRHVTQYAVLGPLFWPAYWLSCAWSWWRTGEYGARNPFERHAGLHTGGYRDLPTLARTRTLTTNLRHHAGVMWPTWAGCRVRGHENGERPDWDQGARRKLVGRIARAEAYAPELHAAGKLQTGECRLRGDEPPAKSILRRPTSPVKGFQRVASPLHPGSVTVSYGLGLAKRILQARRVDVNTTHRARLGKNHPIS